MYATFLKDAVKENWKRSEYEEQQRMMAWVRVYVFITCTQSEVKIAEFLGKLNSFAWATSEKKNLEQKL